MKRLVTARNLVPLLLAFGIQATLCCNRTRKTHLHTRRTADNTLISFHAPANNSSLKATKRFSRNNSSNNKSNKHLRTLTESSVSSYSTILSSASSSSSSAANDVNSIQSQIIGGTTAAAGEYLWFALLYQGSRWECGASLVAPDLLLSAAHCNLLNLTHALVGAWDLNTESPQSVVVEIVQTVPHPRFNDTTLDNDLVVIRISPPVTSIAPVAINWDVNVTGQGDPLTIMGFGLTDSGNDDDSSHVLMQAQVTEVSTKQCSDYYVNSILPARQMCVWNQYPIRNSCYGDSGGPLILVNTSYLVNATSFSSSSSSSSSSSLSSPPLLVGVTSYGSSSGCESAPGVFSRTSGYASWLLKTICQLSSYATNYFDCSSAMSASRKHHNNQTTATIQSQSAVAATSPTPAVALTTPRPAPMKHCTKLGLGPCKFDKECCNFAAVGIQCNQTTNLCVAALL